MKIKYLLFLVAVLLPTTAISMHIISSKIIEDSDDSVQSPFNAFTCSSLILITTKEKNIFLKDSFCDRFKY